VILQAPAVQATVAHVVPVGVQSASLRQVTQLPLPSHWEPPFSAHVVPVAA
jgi:hypothetical protein